MLIELVKGDLITAWFKLEIDTHTTDAVLYELDGKPQHFEIMKLVQGQLIGVSPMYADSAFAALEALAATASEMGVSIPEASAFLLADKMNAILLTSNGGLQLQAEARGVTVCGVLWVLDMLLFNGVVSFDVADGSLRDILGRGAQLPSADCERRFRAWSKGEAIEPRQV